MTVNEAKRVIRLLAVEYPNEYKGFTAESLLDKARLWAELFEDTPGEAVGRADPGNHTQGSCQGGRRCGPARSGSDCGTAAGCFQFQLQRRRGI